MTYVSFVPLTEGSSIDLDNSSLDEGVGTDQLVVRGVVNLAIKTTDNPNVRQCLIQNPMTPNKAEQDY